VFAESSGSAGYLPKATSSEPPVLGMAWPTLPLNSESPCGGYGHLWKSNETGNGQRGETAAAFRVGRQLKAQGLPRTVGAWQVKYQGKLDIYAEGLSVRDVVFAGLGVKGKIPV